MEAASRIESRPKGRLLVPIVRALVGLPLACLWACDSGASVPEDAFPTAIIQATLPEALRAVHAPDLELEGTWIASWIPGSDSTQLELALRAPGLYSVRVQRTPDFGTSFHYETVAQWQDGRLTLSGTDANTHGATLYPARVRDEACLIPSGSLELLSSGDLWNAQAEHAFRRSGAPPSVLRRQRALVEAHLRERERGELELGPEDEAELRWMRYYLPGPEDENVPLRHGYD